jgi:hypothetical protein
MSTNLPILVSKITNENTKILLPLDEQDHMPNHGEINIQIYKNLSTWDYLKIFLLKFFIILKNRWRNMWNSWIMIHNTKIKFILKIKTKWYMYKCISHTCRTLVGNKYKCTIYFRSICNNIVLYFLFNRKNNLYLKKWKSY